MKIRLKQNPASASAMLGDTPDAITPRPFPFPSLGGGRGLPPASPASSLPLPPFRLLVLPQQHLRGGLWGLCGGPDWTGRLVVGRRRRRRVDAVRTGYDSCCCC